MSENVEHLRHKVPPLVDEFYDFEAWKEHLGQPPITQCHNGWTFNSWDMKKRIDYVFVDQKLVDKVTDIRIVGKDINQTIAGLNPQGGVKDMHDILYPSDHRFLLVDLEV